LMVKISGVLTRLYCPFIVECIADTQLLKRGELYTVDQVGFVENEISYLIKGKYYGCTMFRIQ